MKKELKMCDVCGGHHPKIAVSSCDLCKKDVCKVHTYPLTINRVKNTLCPKCCGGLAIMKDGSKWHTIVQEVFKKQKVKKMVADEIEKIKSRHKVGEINKKC